MRPKTILVCLTTAEQTATILKVAVPLARKHGAHLVGLRTVEAILVYPGIAMHIPEDTFLAFRSSQNKETAEIEDIFEHHTSPEDFVSEFRVVRADTRSAIDRMIESARAADLVIMAQDGQDTDPRDMRQIQRDVIRECGRPVLVIPADYQGPEIGEKIVLGWSETREAARAAHDVLCIAEPDARLTVLSVGRTAEDLMAADDAIAITEMFARHGLRPTLEHRDPLGQSIASVLSAVAFEKGAGMIVTGAFGHSSTYDFVIGATSYELLRDHKVPILFSK